MVETLENLKKQQYANETQRKIEDYTELLGYIPISKLNELSKDIKNNMDVELGKSVYDLCELLISKEREIRNARNTLECMLDIQKQYK